MGRREGETKWQAACLCVVLLLSCIPSTVCAQRDSLDAPLSTRRRAAQVARAIRVGDARAEAGRHAFALFAYARALEFDPRSAQAHDGSGRQLIALGLARDAVPHFRRAALLESHVAERWALLGDACRIAQDRPCATSAYLTALRLAPSRRATVGYDALGGGAFARSYEFGLDEATALDLDPALVGGPAFALGMGTPYAGMGLQLSWHFTPPEQRLTVAPYAALGLTTTDDPVAGLAAGVYAMLGEMDRWVLHAGFGALARLEFHLYDELVASRTVHGLTFAFGRQWNYLGGVFLRALIGASFPVDAYVSFDDANLELSLGLGYKP